MPKFSTKQVGILDHNSPVFKFAGLVDKFDKSPALFDVFEHVITSDEDSGDTFLAAFDSDVVAVLEGYSFDPTSPAAATALNLTKITSISGKVVTFAGSGFGAGTQVLVVARCQEV